MAAVCPEASKRPLLAVDVEKTSLEVELADKSNTFEKT